MAVNDLRSISVGVGYTTRTQAEEANSSGTRLAGMHVARTVGASGGQETLSYYFPFTPQQIQYSNFSPEITEISRPGRLPIVAFSRLKARQVAFKFLIAQPQDGLTNAVDESIEFIHRMALEAKPVYFTNLDRQITNPIAPEASTSLFWSIVDLSFSSIRRNKDNSITAAEANLTLVENNNPTLRIADLPRISYVSTPPRTNPPRSVADRKEDYNSYTQGSIRGDV